MEPALKKTLKSVTLALRHLLEGTWDTAGIWQPGDLENRLASIGVRGDREPRPIDELELNSEDQQARRVVDAYLKLREEAGVDRKAAVVEFLRETAYTWANRLIALRCMESRELIDPVILQQQAYGGRSLEHHRLAQRQPELCAGEDDGLFAVLDKVFREQTQRLPMLFDPQAPGIALRPSPAAIKDCFGLLSLNADTLRKYRIRIREEEDALPDAEPPNPFIAPDALGWTYQYWNTEEKDRVFEKVRTVKGTKIAGADIVPATQLYTEDYMVKFLVQNSLGATWMAMHPDSTLSEHWEYYVRDADRAPVALKPVREITFLDPACGSGHFLIEAFDLYFAIYLEEGELTDPEEICTAILAQNLFGIDIDARAVQIAEAALWMKAAERSFDYSGAATNLVAAIASHLKGPAWEEFLASFTKEPSIGRVLRKFAQTMEHIDEIGSLARPAEDLRYIIHVEHATWEQQVREQKEANCLFPEMREEALSGQLPFNEISDEEFGDRLFYRARAGIDAFTEKARESGEFDDQMLASETRAGFRLVDLLSRKYDIVAANPPWMGLKHYGVTIHKHVTSHFREAKRDVYAAFIVRSIELAHEGGYCALVTQQAWLYLTAFASLRYCPDRNASFRGVLIETTIESLVQLGRYAFSELGNGIILPLLFTLRKREPIVIAPCATSQSLSTIPDSRIRCFRLSAPRISTEQDQLLRRGISGNAPTIVTTPSQSSFLSLPKTPLPFWLSEGLLHCLSSSSDADRHLFISEGIGTRAEKRFLRFTWEAPSNMRWRSYAKGGGYGRWAGFRWYAVDWGTTDNRVKCYITDKYPPDKFTLLIRHERYYGRRNITYSSVAQGSLSFRDNGDCLFSDSGPGAFWLDDELHLPAVAAILNSRLLSYLARALFSGGVTLNRTYVECLPVTRDRVKAVWLQSSRQISSVLSVKEQIVARSLLERTFCSKFCPDNNTEVLLRIKLYVKQLCLEGHIEESVDSVFRITSEDRQLIALETGDVATANPLIDGYDSIEGIWDDEIPLNANRVRLSGNELETLRTNLCECYLAGFGFDPPEQESENEAEGNSDDDDVDDETSGAQILIPSENVVEELSRHLKIHPISVFWLLKEGIEQNGWRCPSQHHELTSDRLTLIVLHFLGHRWPEEVAAGILVPSSVNVDGMISITSVPGESALPQRVDERFRREGGDASEFAELMGKTLEAWLACDFFKHHTRQLKKRPIAWQLQSSSFTARHTPAIACLIYYHKLDSDRLPKVRKMAEDLRKSRETELRGIITVAPEARSDRQEARRVELEDTIAELQRFDTTLESIATTGFGPEPVRAKLRQYALDDAVLVMKARWLSRFSDLIFAGPLPDWVRAASQTELHADFGLWITSAMSHLDHYCALVGPPAPDQSDLKIDPTPNELAVLISPEAVLMQRKAISLGCEVWWSQLERIVFAPLKEHIKQLKAEQKECEATLKSEPEPDEAATRKLKARVKELKAEVKMLDKDLKEQTTKAKQVRGHIEGWRSDEPATWGDWLAEQPMFDQISSLDHRRPAPKTIAEFIAQESLYAPDINDGVRVNITPLQKAGILAADVLAAKDLDKAIADRAEWRSDERRWVREGKLPQPGWWPEAVHNAET